MNLQCQPIFLPSASFRPDTEPEYFADIDRALVIAVLALGFADDEIRPFGASALLLAAYNLGPLSHVSE